MRNACQSRQRHRGDASIASRPPPPVTPSIADCHSLRIGMPGAHRSGSGRYRASSACCCVPPFARWHADALAHGPCMAWRSPGRQDGATARRRKLTTHRAGAARTACRAWQSVPPGTSLLVALVSTPAAEIRVGQPGDGGRPNGKGFPRRRGAYHASRGMDRRERSDRNGCIAAASASATAFNYAIATGWNAFAILAGQINARRLNLAAFAASPVLAEGCLPTPKYNSTLQIIMSS